MSIKKIILIVAAAVIALCGVGAGLYFGLAGSSPKIETISLTTQQDLNSVFVDEQFYITAELTPANARQADVVWSSTNSTVATVDRNGQVTTKSPGSVKIIATSKNSSAADYCSFAVLNTSLAMNPVNQTYNGQPQYTSVTNPAAGADIYYSYTGTTAAGGKYGPTSLSKNPQDNAPCEAGTYAVKAQMGSDPSATDFNVVAIIINSKPITLTAESSSKEFGTLDPTDFTLISSDFAGGGALAGLVDGDTLGYSVVRQGSGDLNNENAGNYTVAPVITANNANYAVTCVGAVFTITPKPISIKVPDSLTSTYGEATLNGNALKSALLLYDEQGTLMDASYPNPLGLDWKASLIGNPSTAANQTTLPDAGTYGIMLGNLTSANFNILNKTDGTYTINPRPITLTPIAGQSKYAGEAEPALMYAAGNAIDGSLNNGLLSRNMAGTAEGEYVGFYDYTLASAANSFANYTFTVAGNEQFEIKSNTVQIGMQPVDQTYNPDYTDNLSDYLTNISYILIINGTAKPAVVNENGYITLNGTDKIKVAAAAGEEITDSLPDNVYKCYAVSLSTADLLAAAGAGSYSVVYTGTPVLNIDKAAIYVLLNNQTKIYGDPDPQAFSAPVLGTDFAITSQFLSGDNFANTISNITITRTADENAGNYALTGSCTLISSKNYYTVQFNTDAVLSITQRPLYITAEDVSVPYGSAEQQLSYYTDDASALAGGAHTLNLAAADQLNDVLAGSLMRYSGTDAGTYQISGSNLSVNNNYTLNYTAGTYKITPRHITISIVPQAIDYGSTIPQITPIVFIVDNSGSTAYLGSYTAPQNYLTGSLGVDSSGSLLAGRLTPGSYNILQGTLNINSNFVIDSVSGSVTVNKLNVVLSFNNVPFDYGVSTPAASPVFEPNLISGDTYTMDTSLINLTQSGNQYTVTDPYQINLLIKNGSVDVTGCYTVVINQTKNIVYTQNKGDISIAVVSDGQPACSVVYTGDEAVIPGLGLDISGTQYNSPVQDQDGNLISYQAATASWYFTANNGTYNNTVAPADAGAYTVSVNKTGGVYDISILKITKNSGGDIINTQDITSNFNINILTLALTISPADLYVDTPPYFADHIIYGDSTYTIVPAVLTFNGTDYSTQGTYTAPDCNVNNSVGQYRASIIFTPSSANFKTITFNNIQYVIDPQPIDAGSASFAYQWGDYLPYTTSAIPNNVNLSGLPAGFTAPVNYYGFNYNTNGSVAAGLLAPEADGSLYNTDGTPTALPLVGTGTITTLFIEDLIGGAAPYAYFATAIDTARIYSLIYYTAENLPIANLYLIYNTNSSAYYAYIHIFDTNSTYRINMVGYGTVAPTNAGFYIVTANITNDNYTVTNNGFLINAYQISKATPTFFALNNTSFTYGDALNFIFSVNPSSVAGYVQVLNYLDMDNNTVSKSTFPLDVGPYYIAAELNSANYYQQKNLPFTVTKATPTITATIPHGQSITGSGNSYQTTYDGSLKQLGCNVNGITHDGIIATDGDTDLVTVAYSPANPIDAGTYTVTFTFSGNNNYNYTQSTVTLTINQAGGLSGIVLRQYYYTYHPKFNASAPADVSELYYLIYNNMVYNYLTTSQKNEVDNGDIILTLTTGPDTKTQYTLSPTDAGSWFTLINPVSFASGTELTVYLTISYADGNTQSEPQQSATLTVTGPQLTVADFNTQIPDGSMVYYTNEYMFDALTAAAGGLLPAGSTLTPSPVNAGTALDPYFVYNDPDGSFYVQYRYYDGNSVQLAQVPQNSVAGGAAYTMQATVIIPANSVFAAGTLTLASCAFTVVPTYIQFADGNLYNCMADYSNAYSLGIFNGTSQNFSPVLNNSGNVKLNTNYNTSSSTGISYSVTYYPVIDGVQSGSSVPQMVDAGTYAAIFTLLTHPNDTNSDYYIANPAALPSVFTVYVKISPILLSNYATVNGVATSYTIDNQNSIASGMTIAMLSNSGSTQWSIVQNLLNSNGLIIRYYDDNYDAISFPSMFSDGTHTAGTYYYRIETMAANSNFAYGSFTSFTIAKKTLTLQDLDDQYTATYTGSPLSFYVLAKYTAAPVQPAGQPNSFTEADYTITYNGYQNPLPTDPGTYYVTVTLNSAWYTSDTQNSKLIIGAILCAADPDYKSASFDYGNYTLSYTDTPEAAVTYDPLTNPFLVIDTHTPGENGDPIEGWYLYTLDDIANFKTSQPAALTDDTRFIDICDAIKNEVNSNSSAYLSRAQFNALNVGTCYYGVIFVPYDADYGTIATFTAMYTVLQSAYSGTPLIFTIDKPATISNLTYNNGTFTVAYNNITVSSASFGVVDKSIYAADNVTGSLGAMESASFAFTLLNDFTIYSLDINTALTGSGLYTYTTPISWASTNYTGTLTLEVYILAPSLTAVLQGANYTTTYSGQPDSISDIFDNILRIGSASFTPDVYDAINTLGYTLTYTDSGLVVDMNDLTDCGTYNMTISINGSNVLSSNDSRFNGAVIKVVYTVTPLSLTAAADPAFMLTTSLPGSINVTVGTNTISGSSAYKTNFPVVYPAYTFIKTATLYNISGTALKTITQTSPTYMSSFAFSTAGLNLTQGKYYISFAVTSASNIILPDVCIMVSDSAIDLGYFYMGTDNMGDSSTNPQNSSLVTRLMTDNAALFADASSSLWQGGWLGTDYAITQSNVANWYININMADPSSEFYAFADSMGIISGDDTPSAFQLIFGLAGQSTGNIFYASSKTGQLDFNNIMLGVTDANGNVYNIPVSFTVIYCPSICYDGVFYDVSSDGSAEGNATDITQYDYNGTPQGTDASQCEIYYQYYVWGYDGTLSMNIQHIEYTGTPAMSVSYSGESNNEGDYNSGTKPSDAGSYTAAITFNTIPGTLASITLNIDFTILPSDVTEYIKSTLGDIYTDGVTYTYNQSNDYTADLPPDATVNSSQDKLIYTYMIGTTEYDLMSISNPLIDAGTYTITAEVADGNCTGSVTFTLTITPAPLIITATAITTPYGISPTFSYTSSGLYSQGHISGGLGRVAGNDVGTYAITQGSLSAGSNYTITFYSADLIIKPATLTVTSNADRPYGQPNPELTPSYSGFAYSDNESVISGEFVLTTTADINSDVGTYTIYITQGSASAKNYVFDLKNGTLTIYKVQIALPTIDPDTFEYTGSPQGPAVTRDETQTSIVSGSTLSATDAGGYYIEIALNDTTNYEWEDNSVNDVQLLWSITPAPLNRTATLPGWVYNSPNTPQITSNPDNAGYTVQYSANGGATWATVSTNTVSSFPNLNAGTYTVRIVFNATQNYQGNTVTIPLTVTPQPLTPPTLLQTDFIYTGNPIDITSSLSNYDNNLMDLSGQTETDIGDYILTVTLKTANYMWAGGITDVTFNWTIYSTSLITLTPNSSNTMYTLNLSPTPGAETYQITVKDAITGEITPVTALTKSDFINSQASIDVTSYLTADGNYTFTYEAYAAGGSSVISSDCTYAYTATSISDFQRWTYYFDGNAYNSHYITTGAASITDGNVTNPNSLEVLIWYTILYMQQEVRFYWYGTSSDLASCESAVGSYINDYPYLYSGLSTPFNMHADSTDFSGGGSFVTFTGFNYYLTQDRTVTVANATTADLTVANSHRNGSDDLITYRQNSPEPTKDTSFNKAYETAADSGTARNFKIDTAGTKVPCFTTDQLFMAMQYGAQPIFPDKTCAAYIVYQNARLVLSQINSDGLTDYQKVFNIYTYLCENVTYDNVLYNYMNYINYPYADAWAGFSSFYLEGIFYDLNNQVAVCDGISKAFVLMCGIEGISSIKINGTAKEGSHAWNEVNINGICYLVDCTWGIASYTDQTTDHNGNLILTEYISYAYFLVDAIASHAATYQIWSSATHNYNYYQLEGLQASSATEIAAILNSLYAPGKGIELKLTTPASQTAIATLMSQVNLYFSHPYSYMYSTTDGYYLAIIFK